MEKAVQFLFVTFLILIAIIGYRALLRRFQKGQVNHQQFCELYPIDELVAIGEITFYFVCPAATEVLFGIWQNQQLVLELKKEQFEAGGHLIRFESTALPNGVYYYGIQTSHQHTTKRMEIAN
ncbi:MAG: hypothetical protein RLZZ301_1273 [Bacteroidota bacterium]|jgi:hypothetical protein